MLRRTFCLPRGTGRRQKFLTVVVDFVSWNLKIAGRKVG